MTRDEVAKSIEKGGLDAILLGHTFRGFIDHRLESFYLTGYDFIDDTLMFYTKDGEAIIFSWPAEIKELENKVQNAVFIDVYKECLNPDLIKRVIKEHKLKKIGALSFWSPFALDLKDKLGKGGVDVSAIRNIVTEARATKDEGELEKLKKAQLGSECLIEDIIDRIAEADVMNGHLAENGKYLTVGDLKAGVLQRAYELDLYWHFPHMFILSSGKKTVEGHNMGEKSDKIKANSPIIIDMVPRSTNFYCGNITRTVVKGNADKNVKQAYGGSLRMTVDLIDSKMKEMNSYGDLFQFFNKRFKYYKSIGLESSCAYGHGIGLWYHELPWIQKVYGNFKKGHVFTTEPGISDYGRKFAVRIGNMWTVDKDKPNVVSSHSKEKLIDHLEMLEV